MPATVRNYQVISQTPVVVEDETAVSYAAGAVFSALDNNPSILRLLALGDIVPVTLTPSPGGFVVIPGPTGPMGPVGPVGPPGPQGAFWRDPVAVQALVGARTVAQINVLTPLDADSYIVEDAGTINPGGVEVSPGDIVEYNEDDAVWRLIVENADGFPPKDTRAIASSQTPLVAPLVDGTDDGKILNWDGTSLTPSELETPTEGWAALITGQGAVDENNGFRFDGVVPTGTWVQFTAGVGIVFAATEEITSIDAGDTADGGVSSNLARGDHRHAAPTATPVNVGTTNAAGSSGFLVHSDHVHAVPRRVTEDKDLTPLPTSGNGSTTGITISRTPALGAYVCVLVNGVSYPITGDLLGAAYFSIDGGVTPRAVTAIAAGDTLYWNGDNVGFELSANDVVDLDYSAF